MRSTNSTVDGVLVIDKPAGMTSHDVVDVVRKRLSTRKVGHAGTLDPDATGLLIVGAGRATRFLDYARMAPKRYLAEARWGVVTSTQDSSGATLSTSEANVDRESLEKVCMRFRGEIQQIPPMVSAVKVGGERLYAMARRGEEVEREPRPATVHRLDVIDVVEPDYASFDVTVSGGTYIRTLINDIGAALGCGGHMTSLRRIENAGFTQADAVGLDEISAEHLLPLAASVRSLPSIDIDEDSLVSVRHGRPLDIGREDDGPFALLHEGELVAVYRSDAGRLIADRVVAT